MRYAREMVEWWESQAKKDPRKAIAGEAAESWDTCAIEHVILVDRGIAPDDVVLDIGCGIGRLTKILAKRCKQIIGLDTSPTMAAAFPGYVGQQNAEVRVVEPPNLRWPVEDGTIDYAYSILCWQHLPTVEMSRHYLSEACRVLRPGGMLRIQTHRGLPSEKFCEAFGAYYPSHVELRWDLLAAGFDVLDVVHGPGWVDWIWASVKKKIPPKD